MNGTTSRSSLAIDWKAKLAAYLHDPPSKALDIRTHGERSDAAFRQAGFVDTEIGNYFKEADHTAAAADRLPFPASRSAGLTCSFDGVRNAFRHPLGGGTNFAFHAEFKTVEQGIEGEGTVQPVLAADSLKQLKDDDERWRARFFAHWRLWAHHAAKKDYRLALLPADTRIPDHSIWTHMQVVSAFAGCVNDDKMQPAFLKFQLGPVQDFIAQARSIRDLWSGSYLLSWLMAAGLKALSANVGPDAVIFPNLRGQPLFDLHWRRDLWNRVKIGSASVWNSLEDDTFARNLLTPNLPNVFLAVVPAGKAAELGRLVENAIGDEWLRIAESVWKHCDRQVLPGVGRTNLTADEGALTRDARQRRFKEQAKRFLSVSWQATAWPETLEQALKLAGRFGDSGMPVVMARERVKGVKDTVEEQMPIEHRDGRYYIGGQEGPKARLNNVGLAWSVILALNGWQLDAVRQTRGFRAWKAGGWEASAANNKDSLNGRDEAVAGGRVWRERCDALGAPWKTLFKKDDWVGAVTLIKRLWHIAYLAEDPWNLETGADKFPMPNTRGIAAHKPFEDAGEDADDDKIPDDSASEKYFAVLALDGDEIGKWVSGEKTPSFKTQLANYSDGSGNQSGAMEYFTRDSDPDGRGRLRMRYENFLNGHRPLSPGYHLQLSEALSNFALWCAGAVVESFEGRLIYSGGDDVLALVPADTAMSCAKTLRAAFRGDPDGLAQGSWRDTQGKLWSTQPGFVFSSHKKDDSERPVPFLVPGPAADCSVGIAVAHFKSPLQDVVRAAQAAEKRAKQKLGRAAVAVTLMKRSGETIEWGCKWKSGGIEAYDAMLTAMASGAVSGKFPHRVVELLEGYYAAQLGTSGAIEPHEPFDREADEILLRDVGLAAERQKGPRYSSDTADGVRNSIEKYLRSISDSRGKVAGLIGLCQAAAFTARNRSPAQLEAP
ncbi:MAG: type III-B CRISPR-associated protein Cas10/Cmr2 [Limisphaerales bacterium]